MNRITKKIIRQGAAVSLSLFVLSSTITPSFASEDMSLAVESTADYANATADTASPSKEVTAVNVNSSSSVQTTSANMDAEETAGVTITDSEPAEAQEALAIEVSGDQQATESTSTDVDSAEGAATDVDSAEDTAAEGTAIDFDSAEGAATDVDSAEGTAAEDTAIDFDSAEDTTTNSDAEEEIDDSAEPEQQIPAEESSSVVLEEGENVSIQTNNDKLTIFIKGLTDAQQEEVYSYIRENVNFSVTDGYKKIDIEKPYFTDTEKLSVPGYDMELCWAATASNMLWLSGYAQNAINPKTNKEFQSVDEVFDYFRHTFTDEAGHTHAGIHTFLTGEYYFQGQENISQLRHEVTGLLPDISSAHYAMAMMNETDIEYLDDMKDYSMGLIIKDYYPEYDQLMDQAHAVTVVGYITDDTATSLGDRYKAIIYADSDSHLGYTEYPTDPEERFLVASTAPRVYSVAKLKYVDLGMDLGKKWTLTTFEGSPAYTFIDSMYFLSDYIGKNNQSDTPDQPDAPTKPTKPATPNKPATPVHNKPSASHTQHHRKDDKVLDAEFSTEDPELLMELRKYDYEEICARMKEERLFVYSPEEWFYKLSDECAFDIFVNAPLESLQKVVLDGEELELYDEEKHTGDYKVYDFENGVFFISFNKEFMQTLEKGRHKLRIQMVSKDRIDDIIVE